MQLIVITAPDVIEEEAVKITNLLDAGLETLHLRKPEWSSEQFELFVKSLPPKYYKKMVIHSNYSLIGKYNLKGIHLTGKYIQEMNEGDLNELIKKTKRKGLTVSTSFHTLQEIRTCAVKYSYAFLSPVFDSISKANYPAAFDLENVKDCLVKTSTPIIALGGINENTIQKVTSLGFSGAAVLGSIWNNNTTPTTTFQTLIQKIR